MSTRLATILSCIGVLLLLATTVSHAQTQPATSATPSKYHDIPMEDVTTLMGEKLFRGLANIATGWGEIPRQIILTTQNEGPLGVPLGLFKGIMMTVLRTATGVVEVALFLAPAPGFYDPILSPGLVWEPAVNADASPTQSRVAKDGTHP